MVQESLWNGTQTCPFCIPSIPYPCTHQPFLLTSNFLKISAFVSWRKCSGSACWDYQGIYDKLSIVTGILWYWYLGDFISCLLLQVLGTPTREEIRCMNPNYTEFKFPPIKAHPWHKVSITCSIMQYLSGIFCSCLTVNLGFWCLLFLFYFFGTRRCHC